MSRHEAHEEIASALRACKPTSHVPDGLEQRILESLATHARHPKSPPRWPRLILPAAAAAAVLTIALWPRPSEHVSLPQTHSTPPPGVVDRTEIPPSVLALARNPLEDQAQAIGRDVGRAGRFLLDCLPSLDPLSR
jgi:hypothetical protein